MHWNEFMDSAERLVRGSAEGDWRSAVSRAYYAVFHHFREYLLSHRLDVGRGGEAHFNLYSGLHNCGYPDVSRIATRIDDLRSNRVAADYNLRKQFDQSDADDLVAEALAVVADFAAIRSGIVDSQIVAGAKHYLQGIGRLPRTP